MYVLHYCIDNASLAVRLVLEELGQPFEARLLDREHGAQDSAAYRALQPLGLIPALETPDGPIFETAAILLWLADRHGALAPAPDTTERAEFLKWYFFTNSHLHSAVMQVNYPERYAGAPEAVGPFLRGALARVEQALAELDKVARRAPWWFSPEAPSILGYYVSMLVRWLRYFPPDDPRHIDLDRFSGLAALGAGLETRPAALKAARDEGLGATIFTAPEY